MKKILLVCATPRRGGNSDIVTSTLASDLAGCDVTVFTMREKRCFPCKACAACQGRESQLCVQDDDITLLLPLIDACDALALATPIYNHQISSQAKLFIERFYPFFHVGKKALSNTSKYGKKAALVCSCWGSPKDVIENYAAWTVKGFSQIGAEETKALVFDGIPAPGQILEKSAYLEQLHSLAQWLKA